MPTAMETRLYSLTLTSNPSENGCAESVWTAANRAGPPRRLSRGASGGNAKSHAFRWEHWRDKIPTLNEINGLLGEMAETEGFEPSVPFWGYAHLANECLQPLGHVSGAPSMPEAGAHFKGETASHHPTSPTVHIDRRHIAGVEPRGTRLNGSRRRRRRSGRRRPPPQRSPRSRPRRPGRPARTDGGSARRPCTD